MGHLGEYAVDPGADFDGGFPWLDMQVAGAEFDGVLHHAIDQHDDLGARGGDRFGLEIVGRIAHIGLLPGEIRSGHFE